MSEINCVAIDLDNTLLTDKATLMLRSAQSLIDAAQKGVKSLLQRRTHV